MDRAKFFAAVRSSLFAGKMAGTLVQGIDAILDEAERRQTPPQHLAAILAEAHHETGRPNAACFGKSQLLGQAADGSLA